VIRGAVLIAILGACSGKAPVRGGGEAGTERDAAIANVAPAPDGRTCVSAKDDVATRAPGADPGDPIDVDGDGAADPVFRDCGGSSNCDFLIYAEAGGCARFLGTVHGAPYADPWCIDPGTADRPCRISINRHMIHGEAQQYFFEHVDGAYVETGTGELYPP
jgi:hypothetical protein